MDDKSRKIARLILKYYQNQLDLAEKEELESWFELYNFYRLSLV